MRHDHSLVVICKWHHLVLCSVLFFLLECSEKQKTQQKTANSNAGLAGHDINKINASITVLVLCWNLACMRLDTARKECMVLHIRATTATSNRSQQERVTRKVKYLHGTCHCANCECGLWRYGCGNLAWRQWREWKVLLSFDSNSVLLLRRGRGRDPGIHLAFGNAFRFRSSLFIPQTDTTGRLDFL